MNSFRYDRIVDFFAGIDLAMGILWLGLAAFTLGLLILRYTRWGQSHQLEKCMAMSVLAHLLILGYFATMRIVNPPLGGDGMCFIALEEDTDSKNGEPGGNRPLSGNDKGDGKEQPWQMQADTATQLKAPELKPAPDDHLLESKRLLSELESKLLAPSPLGQTALDQIITPKPQAVDANAPIGQLVPIDANDSLAAETTAPQSGNPNGIDADRINLSGHGNFSEPNDADIINRRLARNPILWHLWAENIRRRRYGHRWHWRDRRGFAARYLQASRNAQSLRGGPTAGATRKAKRLCKLPCTGWPIIRPTTVAGTPTSTARAGNWSSKDAIA